MGHISRKMGHQNTHHNSFTSVHTHGFPKVIQTQMVSLNSLKHTMDNWRVEMEQYTSNKQEIKLLREGPKSWTQAMRLGALKQRYKKIMHIDDL